MRWFTTFVVGLAAVSCSGDDDGEREFRIDGPAQVDEDLYEQNQGDSRSETGG